MSYAKSLSHLIFIYALELRAIIAESRHYMNKQGKKNVVLSLIYCIPFSLATNTTECNVMNPLNRFWIVICSTGGYDLFFFVRSSLKLHISQESQSYSLYRNGIWWHCYTYNEWIQNAITLSRISKIKCWAHHMDRVYIFILCCWKWNV